ncbi:MAG: class I SAM-dependent methyltransferase [Bacteroidota bacterium]|jgi:cyclopropane fatty-acyl-phospholipid synthase-like methyltransferase|nr:class I SAM-dependent methyltransferase [Bacteroidota bacterium]
MSEELDATAYYHIAYRSHRIMNPLGDERFLLLAAECGLGAQSRVLDVGSGNGWSALLLARRWGCSVTMVDVSAQWTAQARALFEREGLAHLAEIHMMDAQDFDPEPGRYDLVLCLGTAPLYGGFSEALKTFARVLAPGCHVIIGEASVRLPLPKRYAEYLDRIRWDVPGERQLLRTIEQCGFALLWNLRSTHDEWDRYMSMQWKAISDHARVMPDDEQAQGFLDWVRDEQEVYLRFQRHWMDWNVMLLRVD